MATMATIQERASARFRFEALGSKRSADDSDDDEDPSELERSAIKFDLFPKILAPLKEFAQRHLDSATLSKFGLAGSTTDDLSQTDPGSLTARRKQGMDDLLAILRVVAEVEELDPGELIATKASTASGNDSVFAVLSGALVSEDAGTGADATLYRPGALLQEECFLLGAAPEASLRAVGGMQTAEAGGATSVLGAQMPPACSLPPPNDFFDDDDHPLASVMARGAGPGKRQRGNPVPTHAAAMRARLGKLGVRATHSYPTCALDGRFFLLALLLPRLAAHRHLFRLPRAQLASCLSRRRRGQADGARAEPVARKLAERRDVLPHLVVGQRFPKWLFHQAWVRLVLPAPLDGHPYARLFLWRLARGLGSHDHRPARL